MLFRTIRHFDLRRPTLMELVRELRFRTEAPIADCCAALKEANENMDRALEVLRNKGLAKAVKKGSRVTEHGSVVACVGETFGAAIVTVCSETDFAARSLQFQRVCGTVMETLRTQIISTEGTALDDCAAVHRLLTDAAAEQIQATIAVLGENVTIKSIQPLRFAPHVAEHISIGAYTHGTLSVQNVGRVAGVVAVSRTDPSARVPEEKLVDVARHFVACSGAEGSYAHQNFFGTEETVGQWLKRHGLRFSSSLVVDFGKEPIIHTAPQPVAGTK
ncbi:elongation factor Ts, putative [Trypanosoma brucei brucei TREU927]|uniref:Elongation factor Ts, mitochondrial n=1 Tax=Trypanosoma brucei brucei (strain 927/4 GUTat10.1) TaxID=185431 RepID=Q57W99_TRYB2|nr:elongation factor Ts, putative [Trypanosoma brucei brucei TREU927]AAX70083.1 elongation factor Ts, putative [Trypanosoma brucei]AAZ10396.1 elongation factor Ts, putative [Trypanosoma brucei brucei TREU927]